MDRAIAPPPPVVGDATAIEGAEQIPRSLDEATKVLAASETAREILGEAFVDHYVRTRDWEVRSTAPR
ncbi:MAG: glutamine synthetase [Sandaracinaceae bacterium]|nr:glutamine synthetase [Sandaracinaceae bacterium]